MVEDTCGTYLFMAPECCDSKVKSYSGRAADIWALGISLFAFTYNKLPFWGDNDMAIIETIINSELEFP